MAKPQYHDPDYMRKWRKSNAEHIKEYRKQWYEQHKNEEKATRDAWNKMHPERVRFFARVSAANRRYPGRLTIDDFLEVLKRGNRTCYWCGKTNLTDKQITLEHIRPTNNLDDLTIACRSCNSAHWSIYWGRIPTPEEQRERQLKNKRAYGNANREYLYQKRKEFLSENPEIAENIRKYQRQYYLENAERLKAYAREYHRRKKLEKDKS